MVLHAQKPASDFKMGFYLLWGCYQASTACRENAQLSNPNLKYSTSLNESLIGRIYSYVGRFRICVHLITAIFLKEPAAGLPRINKCCLWLLKPHFYCPSSPIKICVDVKNYKLTFEDAQLPPLFRASGNFLQDLAADAGTRGYLVSLRQDSLKLPFKE